MLHSKYSPKLHEYLWYQKHIAKICHIQIHFGEVLDLMG